MRLPGDPEMAYGAVGHDIAEQVAHKPAGHIGAEAVGPALYRKLKLFDNALYIHG
jgi:hypothetical protein